MTKHMMEKKDLPLKEKCASCFRGPNLFKTLVIMTCVAIVGQQVTVCIRKMINKPITTYTHFEYNRTIAYPSVTFCREPPYKYDKLIDYGLFAHPRYTSMWRDFDFEKNSLERLWQDITYNQSEFFVQLGLNGSARNVNVKATRSFILGTCYTLSPKVAISKASKQTGYSITLQHSPQDVATSTSEHPPGYHVYIHYDIEPFTEVSVNNGGLVDYIYVNTGEEVDLKLTVEKYVKLNHGAEACTVTQEYSVNECTTDHFWNTVTSAVGCSGPWMTGSAPPCRNYSQMRDLITLYVNTYQDYHCTTCPRFCQSFFYNGFVTNRQAELWWDSVSNSWKKKTGDTILQTQIYLHFNSMMVSVHEERYNYDWNLFLSDLGGSIGFLLGLSVIGIIKIAEKIWAKLIGPFVKSIRSKKDSQSEPDTEVVKDDSKGGYVSKCNEWNRKNDLYDINIESEK